MKKFIEIESKLEVISSWGDESMEDYHLMGTEFCWGMEKFEKYIMVMVIQYCEYN